MGLLEAKAKIDKYVSDFSGDLAYFIRDTKNNVEIAHREDEIFPTASAVKIFALGSLLEKVDQGAFKLTDEIEMTPDVYVRGSGVMKELTLGAKFKIKDAAMLMVIVSDNVGTNMAVKLSGGVDGVNDWISRCGLKKAKEPSQIDFDSMPDNSADSAELFGICTAKEFVDYLLLMKNGNMLSPEMKEVFFDIMKRQQCLDQFPRYLPYNPYAPELGLECKMSVANKTGFMVTIRTDVGFVWEDDNEVCYAVLSKNCKDESFWVENEGAICIGNIGKAVYDHVF